MPTIIPMMNMSSIIYYWVVLVLLVPGTGLRGFGCDDFKEEYGSVPDSVITLKINPLNNGKVRQYIESTGQLMVLSRTVTIPFTLQWKKESSGRLATDYAVFTYGHIRCSGGTINGPMCLPRKYDNWSDLVAQHTPWEIW